MVLSFFILYHVLSLSSIFRPFSPSPLLVPLPTAHSRPAVSSALAPAARHSLHRIQIQHVIRPALPRPPVPRRGELIHLNRIIPERTPHLGPHIRIREQTHSNPRPRRVNRRRLRRRRNWRVRRRLRPIRRKMRVPIPIGHINHYPIFLCIYYMTRIQSQCVYSLCRGINIVNLTFPSRHYLSYFSIR